MPVASAHACVYDWVMANDPLVTDGSELAEDVPPGWLDKERQPRPITFASGSVGIIVEVRCKALCPRGEDYAQVVLNQAEAKHLYTDLRSMMYSSAHSEARELYAMIYRQVLADVDEAIAPLRESAAMPVELTERIAAWRDAARLDWIAKDPETRLLDVRGWLANNDGTTRDAIDALAVLQART